MIERILYHTYLDGHFLRYRAVLPFFVDGIEYRPRDDSSGVECVRTMIEIIDDSGCIDDPYSDTAATMYHSDPPTTRELDQWVRHNILPST